MQFIAEGFSPPSQSPTNTWVVCKRKFTCRCCKQEFPKGTEALEFFGSADDGGTYNPWKAVTAKVCKTCADANAWKKC